MPGIDNKILWKPSEERVAMSQMRDYMNYLEQNFYYDFKDYNALYEWSINNPDLFWASLIDYHKIIYEGDLNPSYKESSFLDYPWFPDMKLNFAENLLKETSPVKEALYFIHESGAEKKLTYSELRESVSKLQSYLSPYFKEGDVLAAFMPNCPETVISMLAATSLGGIFTSTSCDFGARGVIDRFGQSRPKVLVTATGYTYNGKYIDLVPVINQIVEAVDSIEKVVYVDILDKANYPEAHESSIRWKILMTRDVQELKFKRVEFKAPLYIMYSSGTTGRPKCIIHSVGGTLTQHLKELVLHTDLRPYESIMYFTTCGWMMWNWLVSSLAIGSKVVLYEGSLGHPSLKAFMQKVEDMKINVWGTSPKFLKAIQDDQKNEYWLEKMKFPSLRTILSTGAPLLPEQFDFVYNEIKTDIHLASICGGTDIISCFMLGNPLLPVHRGQIQSPGLGMAIDCYDSDGTSMRDQQGELVCKRPFISQPLGFLNDDDKSRIKEAYFKAFKDTWYHGDYISIDSNTGGIQVYGRSDATLNPGGVRIGTAEIYRQVDGLDFLVDSVCVGKEQDGDVDVWLFVKLVEGLTLTDEHIKIIKKIIKENATPRHIPKVVKQVNDIPYTRSGKKIELAVQKVLNGKKINNIEAIANPESLDQFKPMP